MNGHIVRSSHQLHQQPILLLQRIFANDPLNIWHEYTYTRAVSRKKPRKLRIKLLFQGRNYFRVITALLMWVSKKFPAQRKVPYIAA